MKRIDFEAHFLTKDYVDTLSKNNGYPRYETDPSTGRLRVMYTSDVYMPVGGGLLDILLDMGEGRIKQMDAAQIDVQVLSLAAPGLEQSDPDMATTLSVSVNNALSDAIARRPDRFKGFAALAPQKPQEAAKELERTVKELGFIGWNTHSNFNGTYLDEKRYRPVLETAASLGAPIYIHPTVPAIPQLRTYGFALAGAGFGFGMETAMCMMRLVLSGVFDELPELKIMIGHYGEVLPFLLTRVDWAVRAAAFSPVPVLKKKPSEYLLQNMLVTTSGNFFEPAFTCTKQALGVERILLGSDYPFENGVQSIAFLEGLPISSEEKDMIYHKNAMRLGFVKNIE